MRSQEEKRTEKNRTFLSARGDHTEDIVVASFRLVGMPPAYDSRAAPPVGPIRVDGVRRGVWRLGRVLVGALGALGLQYYYYELTAQARFIGS